MVIYVLKTHLSVYLLNIYLHKIVSPHLPMIVTTTIVLSARTTQKEFPFSPNLLSQFFNAPLLSYMQNSLYSSALF